MIARFFIFVEIPQQIRCRISTIMGRAAGYRGNPDKTGTFGPRRRRERLTTSGSGVAQVWRGAAALELIPSEAFSC